MDKSIANFSIGEHECVSTAVFQLIPALLLGTVKTIKSLEGEYWRAEPRSS